MTDKIRRILDTLYQTYPNATCELNFSNNEQLAIAVILSAQTTDISVNKVTPKLFNHFKNMDELANAEIEDLEKCIRSIGLYRNKSKNIKLFAICKYFSIYSALSSIKLKLLNFFTESSLTSSKNHPFYQASYQNKLAGNSLKPNSLH